MHHLQEEKEADVQRAILDYLTLKGIFHYRNNSGAFVFPETAATARRFIKAGALGSPDIVCVIKGQYVGIEVKGSKGRQSDNHKRVSASARCGGRQIYTRVFDRRRVGNHLTFDCAVLDLLGNLSLRCNKLLGPIGVLRHPLHCVLDVFGHIVQDDRADWLPH
jgi:hypothetical protein